MARTCTTLELLTPSPIRSVESLIITVERRCLTHLSRGVARAPPRCHWNQPCHITSLDARAFDGPVVRCRDAWTCCHDGDVPPRAKRVRRR
jgi:hypothetical protein